MDFVSFPPLIAIRSLATRWELGICIPRRVLNTLKSRHDSINHLFLILSGDCHQIGHISGMDFSSLPFFTNIRTLHWVGLAAHRDHVVALQQLCRRNKDHLKSLHLDLYSWPIANSIWHKESSDPSDDFSASDFLSKIGALTAMETLCLRDLSLRDVSVQHAEILNIGRLKSLHLHGCKQAKGFLSKLTSTVRKKQINLSLTNFEIIIDGPRDPYYLYLAEFLTSFSGLTHLALVVPPDDEDYWQAWEDVVHWSESLWRGVRHHKETLRDLIFHQEDIEHYRLPRIVRSQILGFAAETLSFLTLRRFAYYGQVGEDVRDPKLITTTSLKHEPHTDNREYRTAVARHSMLWNLCASYTKDLCTNPTVQILPMITTTGRWAMSFQARA
jgi:hypothetical protein